MNDDSIIKNSKRLLQQQPSQQQQAHQQLSQEQVGGPTIEEEVGDEWVLVVDVAKETCCRKWVSGKRHISP